MKYILIIALLAITLIGCGNRISNPKSTEGTPPRSDFYTLSYDGHSWVIWTAYRKGGLVHHPDCRCLRKGNNER